jgi:transposase InsO family protein
MKVCGSPGTSWAWAHAQSAPGRRLVKCWPSDAERPWRNLDTVEFATPEWVDWFNNRRLLAPIGNIPPAELEMAYYRDQQGQAMVAWLNQ